MTQKRESFSLADSEETEQIPDKEKMEIYDALRIEMSELDPETEKGLREISTRICQDLYDKFGHYIPVSKKRNKAEVASTVLVSSDNIATALYELTDTPLKGVFPFDKLLKRRAQRATFTSSGAYSIGNKEMPVALVEWDWFLYNVQDRFKKQNEESQESADKSEADYIAFCTNVVIAHELIHEFANPEIPQIYNELGAWYYSVTISRERFPKITLDPLTEQVMKTYEQLIEACGTAVHRLYFAERSLFSKEVNVNTRSEIMRYLRTDEVRDLEAKIVG